jgi:hypothetical protein
LSLLSAAYSSAKIPPISFTIAWRSRHFATTS